MTNSTKKPTSVFWIIAIIAFLWNLMGVFAYLSQAYMSDEVMTALPEAQRTFMENTPAWVTAAFAIAVFGGTLASVLLLLRKKLATLVFIISFLGVIGQMTYNFLIKKAAEVYGPGGMIMPLLVVLFAILLIWYSKNSHQKGYLS